VADVGIDDGKIVAVGSSLRARGAREIDASRMIVMPGFVETHSHMWSALWRNFVGDGFEYFPAKSATAAAYEPDDVYSSVSLGLAELANAGITAVNNWSHNVRSAEWADAELAAHRDAKVRARFSYGHRDGQPADQLIDFADVDRVRSTWFGDESPFEDLVHLGVNLRGPGNMQTFTAEMAAARERRLPVCVHAGQGPASAVRAAELEQLGYLGPDFMLCHNPATAADRAAIVRTGTPLSLAPHSEMRLGSAGGFHGQLMCSASDGVLISLSFDASSLAPINMFESMNVTWNVGIPWIGSDTESLPPVLICRCDQDGDTQRCEGARLGRCDGDDHPGQAGRHHPDPPRRSERGAGLRHRVRRRAGRQSGKRRHGLHRRSHAQTAQGADRL
jgi:cytosine/adenosine deaminase-related metal-dependent hydrolase